MLRWCLLAVLGVVQARSGQACDFVAPNLVSGESKWNCGGQWSDKQALSLETAKAFAPILIMHPMEQYRLTDPAHYFEKAVIYNSKHKPSSKAGSSPLSYLSVLGRPDQDAILAGAPLGVDGLSTSRVFYNAYPLGEAWVINYHLFYAWNGCSNMAMSMVGHGGQQSTLEFIACPYSVHEADWERVSVVVCPEPSADLPDATPELPAGAASAPGSAGHPDSAQGKVVAAVLSQHNHDELVECSRQQACELEQGHLVVYVGLNSHANFAHASNGTIFGGIRNDLLTSSSLAGVPGLGGRNSRMEGVLVLDRTAKGAKWVPNSTNLVPLPQSSSNGKQAAVGAGGGGSKGPQGREQQRELLAKKKGQTGTKGASAVDEDAWVKYPGFWGTQSWVLPPSVTCFAPGLLHPAPCPQDSPAWHLLARTLGLPIDHNVASSIAAKPSLALPGKGSLPVTANYHSRGGAKQGPLFRNWTHGWWGPRPTNFWRLPAHNLAYRCFVNGCQMRPVLKCLPGMGACSGAKQQHCSGQGSGEEAGQQAGTAHAALGFMRAAVVAWHTLEPVACLVAVMGVLLVLLPWLRLLCVYREEVGDGPLRPASPKAAAPWSLLLLRSSGGGSSSSGGSSGLSSGSESSKTAGRPGVATPLVGLVSLACGLCLVHNIRPYFSLMQASLPATVALVDAVHVLFLGMLALLVAADISCALSGLRSMVFKLQPKGSKAGGHMAQARYSAGWRRWVEVPVQRRAAFILLTVVVVCVGAQAGVQAAHGLVSLLLPLHHVDMPGQPALGDLGRNNSMVLCLLLYVRSLFSRWQVEARATLLVLPCLYYVIRYG